MGKGYLESIVERLEYLEEREAVLTHAINQLFKLLPDQIKGCAAAGRFVGVSRTTMARIVKTGKIPYTRNGKVLSFSPQHLLEYKEGRLVRNNSNLPSVRDL